MAPNVNAAFQFNASFKHSSCLCAIEIHKKMKQVGKPCQPGDDYEGNSIQYKHNKLFFIASNSQWCFFSLQKVNIHLALITKTDRLNNKIFWYIS